MVKEMKKTSLGLLPNDWDVDILEHRLKIQTGGRNTEDKQENGKYPFFVRSSKIEHIDTYHYDCEAILTAGDGVGTGKVFHYINGKFDAHQRVYILTEFNGIKGKYFYYYFRENFLKEVSKYTAKSSVDSVRRDMIAKMAVPIPKIEEQVAIAEALSDVDNLIFSLQKLIEKKKAIKQGAMQELLTGKKRLPGFSGKRKRKKLGNYIKFEVGFPFKSQYFNSQHIGLRLIKNRDLKSDDQVYYTTEDVSSEYIVNNGDVLVGMDGDFTPCIWKKGVALLNQRVGRIGAFGMDLLFSYYLLQQPLQELQIGTGATTVKHLSHFDVENLELTFPEEIKEQQEIAQVLSDMDNDIEQLEKKLSKYQQIKQGMMQELLTGRIRLVETDIQRAI